MSQLSTRRQLELMQQLQQVADVRAKLEESTASTLKSELAAAEEEKNATTEQLVDQFCERRRNLENEFASSKSLASQQTREAIDNLRQQHQQQCLAIEKNFKQTALAIERKKKESEWQTLAVFDAAKDSPRQQLEEALSRLQTQMLQVEGLHRDTNTLLAMRRLTISEETEQATIEQSEESGTAEDRLQQTISKLHKSILDFQSQLLPSVLLEGTRPFGWCIFACVLAIAPMIWLSNWQHLLWPPASLFAGAILSAIGYFTLGRRAKRQTLDQYSKIQTLLDITRNLEQQVREEAHESSRQASEEISLTKHHDLEAAQELRNRTLSGATTRRDEELGVKQSELDVAIDKVNQSRAEALDAANEKFPPLLDQLADERRVAVEQNESRYQKRTTDANSVYESDWAALAENWRTGFQEVANEIAEMRSTCDQLFPNWSVTQWKQWNRPTETPPAIQFGNYSLPLSTVKNGISKDERLIPEQTELELPALMTLDEQPRLVITASGEGRSAAVEMLQAAMLRFLTAMPAGKLRFTIIDPSALGENFATFMHLADYDEQLVGKRIWTDSRQIDERLSLLSDHMEKVLQKFLRNEYETIHDYNRQAGEVSEPYHVLVVANFPSGLSDASIRKLLTIATTGPRCGVYTLISIDEQVKLPRELSTDPLFENSVHIKWDNDQLKWNYPLYERLPLQRDSLPPRDKLNELMRLTALESREASRVEVPFEVIAPDEHDLWSGNTAYELVVPVGRATAKELQSIRLGRGTSQHMLIAGKTGSGKSTLLHALITNAALHFSPQELELYLIDFKKGVEFKTYASLELPHARVIAIESEREFGVSVLQRLDDELRRRGERFRDLGVQDLAGYRDKRIEGGDNPDLSDPMPRILLIVDEFQELFVTDDRLAQDASLLLDRLVRQGRAFGIHVLLGSQTLAGAYSLARSTLGQMAVRIALECSDADAHLILSDDNTAARLLSRPGEAIYNDQNGLSEGNSTFQIAWLPDQQRQQYLSTIRQLHTKSGETVEPAIVFEGNRPADPQENEALVACFDQQTDTSTIDPTIWLGSAVRIEPPTQFTLRRLGGNHLLIVGQDEVSAVGILTNAVISIAAQQASDPATITVLDGTRPESPEQGVWDAVIDSLPGNASVVGQAGLKSAVTALATEVERRGEAPDQHYQPQYLVIHNLAQFRDLRQKEDDFGFTSSLGSKGTNGNAVSVDKHFRNLLREGPAVGVHVLIWCDSYNSLTRFVDRLSMRELDYRVAMQMSSVDSTSLVDSPAASQLGEHRAIFYRDDLGTQVKFRPYSRPSEEWLAWVKEKLATRNLASS